MYRYIVQKKCGHKFEKTSEILRRPIKSVPKCGKSAGRETASQSAISQGQRLVVTITRVRRAKGYRDTGKEESKSETKKEVTSTERDPKSDKAEKERDSPLHKKRRKERKEV